MTHDESGFTLVELMVAIILFAVMSIGIYQVLFSTVRGANTTQQVAEISQDARLGLNRIVRDTREAQQIVTASSTSYRIWSDFDVDGVVDAYEYLQYAVSGGTITLTPLTPPTGGSAAAFTGTEATLTGETAATVVANVSQIGTTPIFGYSSNFLSFDTNGNGEVSSTELDTATGVGNNNSLVDGNELSYISDVNIALKVTTSGRSSNFYAQAQLRNRRYSNL
jgi:prepilin-type N-terminal cleavage/methylation domain-containing protein